MESGEVEKKDIEKWKSGKVEKLQMILYHVLPAKFSKFY